MARRRATPSMAGGDPRLPGFQGRPVKEMTGKFHVGANVLEQKMKLDPNPHDSGDEVCHIVRSIVGGVDHKPTVLAAGVPFIRTENYVVQEIVEVDYEDVKAYLDASREQLEAARREAEKEDLAGGQGVQQSTDDVDPGEASDGSGDDA